MGWAGWWSTILAARRLIAGDFSTFLLILGSIHILLVDFFSQSNYWPFYALSGKRHQVIHESAEALAEDHLSLILRCFRWQV